MTNSDKTFVDIPPCCDFSTHPGHCAETHCAEFRGQAAGRSGHLEFWVPPLVFHEVHPCRTNMDRFVNHTPKAVRPESSRFVNKSTKSSDNKREAAPAETADQPPAKKPAKVRKFQVSDKVS